MTISGATTFLNHVNTSPALQRQLEAALWDTNHVIGLARTLGYSMTASELHTAMDAAWGALSEDELIGIAGGGGSGRDGTGKVEITDTTVDTSSDWDPPPGDISGNSCFFSRTSRR